MLWIAVIVAVWLLAAFVAWWLPRQSPRGDDALAGLAWLAAKLYARWFHGLRVHGFENLPTEPGPGPLIVVANHSAGVDPILIQNRLPFDMRWLMAADMRLPLLDPMWEYFRVIFVARDLPNGESLVPGGRRITAEGLREALRELRRGGVIGIFPEGGLARPPRNVMPFLRGLGILVEKTGARVLPAIIEGTPQVDPAWASLWVPGRVDVRYLPIVEYRGSGLGAEEITEDIRRRIAEAAGWPLNDEPEWVLDDGNQPKPRRARPRDDREERD